MRRWVVPLLAAAAVLLVVGVMWQQRPGASGDDAGFAAGGSGGSVSSDGQGVPPYSGTEPGSAGSPAGDAEDPSGPADGGADVDAGMLPVDRFYRYDGRHLALSYYNGVPECYGTAGTPRVLERRDAVVVSIPRIPAENDTDQACIDIAVLGSVDITLTEPLGGRLVLDGSRDGARVDEADAPVSTDGPVS